MLGVYQGLTRVYRDFICAAPPAAALQGVFKAVAGDDVERGAAPGHRGVEAAAVGRLAHHLRVRSGRGRRLGPGGYCSPRLQRNLSPYVLI